MKLRQRLAKLTDRFRNDPDPPPREPRARREDRDPRYDRQQVREPDRDDAVGMFFAAEEAATMGPPVDVSLDPVSAPQNVQHRSEADDSDVGVDQSDVPRVDELVTESDDSGRFL